MLGFLKRYQKFFFLITAFFVCISIVFFGLLPKNVSQQKDETLFKTRRGKKIKRSQLDGLKAMLLTCNGELMIYGQHLGMQFYSHDPFTEYLVKTGFLKMIADRNENVLIEDFERQLEHEKKFKPYSHPGAKFLSADSVWAQHAPKVRELLKNLQSEKDPKKAFAIKTELFLEESEFSPFALWQFLSERQSSQSWLQPDENLRPQSLALFGYRTQQDWFGEKLINMACQFIYEITTLAKKKGYHVTYAEAEKDLMKLNEHHFEQMQFLGLKEFPDQASYFEAKLQRLGMNRMQMISLWREILTFQQYFNEASQAALLDNLTLKEFEDFASEQVEIAKYSPPEELELKTIRDLAQFEGYLFALGKKRGNLDLNFEMKQPLEVAKKYPQLVEQEVELSYKEVDMNQEALKIKVQDVWKWKTNPKNCTKLVAKFPKLKLDQELPAEEYEKAFDKLDYFTNMQIDQHVRHLLLKKNKDWLKEAFELRNPVDETLKVRYNGQNIPFKGLETSSKKNSFLQKLFKLAQNGKIEDLSTISFDDTHYYQITAIQSKDEPALVSYQQIKDERILDKLLNRILSDAHKNGPYKEEDFEKAKTKVLNKWLEPIKAEILKDYKSQSNDLPKHLHDSFYVQYRLYKPMRDALAYYKNNQDEAPKAFALNSMWTVRSQKDVFLRHDSSEVNEWLKLNVGDWSDVQVMANIPEFVLLLKKTNVVNQHPMQKQIKNELKSEIVKKLALEELETIEFTQL